jgi:hypothetical protein
MASVMCTGEVAAANTATPAAPTASKTAVVRRGPILSKAQPTGICIKAKDRNHQPEAWAKDSAFACKSKAKMGARTARKAR